MVVARPVVSFHVGHGPVEVAAIAPSSTTIVWRSTAISVTVVEPHVWRTSSTAVMSRVVPLHGVVHTPSASEVGGREAGPASFHWATAPSSPWPIHGASPEEGVHVAASRRHHPGPPDSHVVSSSSTSPQAPSPHGRGGERGVVKGAVGSPSAGATETQLTGAKAIPNATATSPSKHVVWVLGNLAPLIRPLHS